MPAREEAAEHVDRLECLREPVAPVPLVAEPLAMADRPQRGGEAERHGDRPRERQAHRRRVRAAREQLDRRDAGGRCEQRVLERAEAEDAHARLAVGDTGLLERVQVEREPALRDERPEAGGDGGRRMPVAHRRSPRRRATLRDSPST